jgi:hypothetical protein
MATNLQAAMLSDGFEFGLDQLVDVRDVGLDCARLQKRFGRRIEEVVAVGGVSCGAGSHR